MRLKFLIILGIFFLFLTGCELNNNPTSKVEELLAKYQALDDSVQYNYADLSNDIEISDDLRVAYNDLIKKQFRNFSYDVKDENIYGDYAIVTVEIEVLDYKSVVEKYPILGEKMEDAIHKEMVDRLENVKDKITYTIDFTVVQNEDDDWKLEQLDSDQMQMLLGIY